MPKVIEKPFIVGGHQLGTFMAYTEIEPEFIPAEPRVRVLPAPFFYEKSLYFYLVNKYEPGENRLFPNGGYEVRDESGGLRNYDLDQVIVHPAVLKHKKTLEKMARKAEKNSAARDRKLKRMEKQAKTPGERRRGRPALDPAVKAAREAAQAEKSTRSKGLRGRPKSTQIKPEKTPKTPGARRGRPALSPEQKAQKIAAKAAVTARSKGRRGRPKSRLS